MCERRRLYLRRASDSRGRHRLLGFTPCGGPVLKQKSNDIELVFVGEVEWALQVRKRLPQPQSSRGWNSEPVMRVHTNRVLGKLPAEDFHYQQLGGISDIQRQISFVDRGLLWHRLRHTFATMFARRQLLVYW
jgi:hypothetical protein